MPTVDLTDSEHAALTGLIKRAIQQDRFPLAARLDSLRSALVKLDPAAQPRSGGSPRPTKPAAKQPTTPEGRPRAS